MIYQVKLKEVMEDHFEDLLKTGRHRESPDRS